MKYIILSLALAAILPSEAHTTIKKYEACKCKSIPGPQGEQGETGPIGEQGLQGDTGATGAQGATGDPATLYAFSGKRSGFALSVSTAFTGFSTELPFYTGTGFNPGGGSFIAPIAGKYSFKVLVNYRYAFTPTISFTTSIPRITLYNITTDTVMLAGEFPVIDYDNSAGADNTDFRAILSPAQVVLAGDVELAAGDIVILRYEPNGNNQQIIFGGEADDVGVVWSGHSI